MLNDLKAFAVLRTNDDVRKVSGVGECNPYAVVQEPRAVSVICQFRKYQEDWVCHEPSS